METVPPTLTDEIEKRVDKIRYIELTEAEAEKIRKSQDFEQLMSGFLPESLTIDDLVFRIITLPEDPQKRKKRVEEILKRGTDRTRFWHTSNFSLFGDGWEYKNDAVKTEGLKPRNLLRCNNAANFKRFGEAHGFLNLEGSIEKGSNAICVFDAKTETGLKPATRFDGRDSIYTFRDLAKRNQALLGIIAIKKHRIGDGP